MISSYVTVSVERTAPREARILSKVPFLDRLDAGHRHPYGLAVAGLAGERRLAGRTEFHRRGQRLRRDEVPVRLDRRGDRTPTPRRPA